MNQRLGHNILINFLILSFIFSPIISYAVTVEITATVPGCGDGVVGVGEQCDGSSLGGASCASQGFSTGTLGCTSICTYDTSSCSITPSGGGGGGGGGGGSRISIPATNVVFTGRAYPLSKVNILKDGQIVVTTIAGPDSNFSATISGLSTGDYTFAVYGEDSNGLRSSLFTFPIYITSGVTTKISGIFIAPTISVDKAEVKKGDNIAIFGQTASNSEVTISVNSEEEFFIKRIADDDGIYLLNFDSSVLEMGQHHTKSKSELRGEITPFGKVVGFTVGTKNVASVFPSTSKKGDLNKDGRVNLVDFSIAAYWYRRSLSALAVPFETEHLNGDGKIDLVDFSIMAFYWTG